MQLSVALVLITIGGGLSANFTELCKCKDSEANMGCACCVKAPVVNEGCVTLDVSFPKLELTTALEVNGKKLYDKAIGPAHVNLCLPTAPISPCISPTYVYTKIHYLKLCVAVGFRVSLVAPKPVSLNLPCLVVDHGKANFALNNYKSQWF